MFGFMRLKSLFGMLPGFVWQSDLKGQRSFLNLAWEKFTGLRSTKMSFDWLGCVYPEDKEALLTLYKDLENNKDGFRVEYRLLGKNNVYRWFLDTAIPLKRRNGSLYGFLGTSCDINSHKMSLLEMEFRSTHDGMTGLFNNQFFWDSLKSVIYKRLPDKTAVIVVDVNKLKAVNDRLGHAEGDLLIKAAAHILRQSFREADIICRIGGDEFAVIMTDIEVVDYNEMTKTLVRKCDRIKKAAAVYNRHFHNPFKVELAVGFSIFRGQEIDVLVKEADEAMYEDKIKSLRIRVI